MWRIVVLTVAISFMTAAVSAQERPQERPQTESGAVSPAGDPTEGARLFASTCGFCHQDGGRVAGRGPKLAGTERSDEFMVNRIRTDKDGAMPAYGRAFSDAQVRSLLAYIRSLKDDSR